MSSSDRYPNAISLDAVDRLLYILLPSKKGGKKQNFMERWFDSENLILRYYNPDDWDKKTITALGKNMLFLWHLLNQHQYKAAAMLFHHTTLSYRVGYSWLWRVGFHLLRCGGQMERLHTSFASLKQMCIPDTLEMNLEYVIFCIACGMYEQALISQTGVRRAVAGGSIRLATERIPEKLYVRELIRLYLGLARYCQWRVFCLENGVPVKELSSNTTEPDSNIQRRTVKVEWQDHLFSSKLHNSTSFASVLTSNSAYQRRAEIQATEVLADLANLPGFIRRPPPCSSTRLDIFVRIYAQLLHFLQREDESVKFLTSYATHCPNNPNAQRYLQQSLMLAARSSDLKQETQEADNQRRIAWTRFVKRTLPYAPHAEVAMEDQEVVRCVRENMDSGCVKCAASILLRLLDRPTWARHKILWKMLHELCTERNILEEAKIQQALRWRHPMWSRMYFHGNEKLWLRPQRKYYHLVEPLFAADAGVTGT